MSDDALHSFFGTKEEAELKAKMGDIHRALDNKEIKKGLEIAMTMGHFANEYFSEQAPWAVYKEDTEKAAGIIARTSSMIAMVGAALSPFLPTLSSEILSLYGELTSDQVSKLYRGNTEVLKEVYAINKTPVKTPKALVPKIEDDTIKELNEALNSLK